MTKKNSKIFAIFWLVCGLGWSIAAIRQMIIKEDGLGLIIYLIATVLSLVLAMAYYKNWVK